MRCRLAAFAPGGVTKLPSSPARVVVPLLMKPLNANGVVKEGPSDEHPWGVVWQCCEVCCGRYPRAWRAYRRGLFGLHLGLVVRARPVSGFRQGWSRRKCRLWRVGPERNGALECPSAVGGSLLRPAFARGGRSQRPAAHLLQDAT